MQRKSRDIWLNHITQLNDITISLDIDYVVSTMAMFVSVWKKK
jgi:hypothetical protein